MNEVLVQLNDWSCEYSFGSFKTLFWKFWQDRDTCKILRANEDLPDELRLHRFFFEINYAVFHPPLVTIAY